jgi:rhodanese-related sulfurtransferase
MRFAVLLTALLYVIAGLLGSAPAKAQSTMISSSVDGATLKKKKQTKLGLYITAKETAALLQSRQDVALIDVRTPEETMFVGYPQAAAANIPFKTIDPNYGFDAKKKTYKTVTNPKFVDHIRSFQKSPAGDKAKILVLMCRSGGRSAAAVNVLADAGFKNVYTMVDSFEGDKDKSGRRTVNGWKIEGLPWTYSVREGLRIR